MQLEIAENELLFIYNSRSVNDRIALGYIKPINTYVVKEIDLQKDSLTETQLKEVANRLEISTGDLIDKKSDNYKNNFAKGDFTEEDLLTALKQEPDLMRTPIALFHQGGDFVESKYDFMKKDMQYSAGKSSKANIEEKE
jgi:arsenate reductase-like glutaredoxin family protein